MYTRNGYFDQVDEASKTRLGGMYRKKECPKADLNDRPLRRLRTSYEYEIRAERYNDLAIGAHGTGPSLTSQRSVYLLEPNLPRKIGGNGMLKRSFQANVSKGILEFLAVPPELYSCY